MKHALVAFGANVPMPGLSLSDTVLAAHQSLLEARLLDRAQSDATLSRLYRTPCFPPGAGPDYVNAAGVYALDDSWTAEAFLALLHRIEGRAGRTRDIRWGARTLDLDLIALDDLVLPDAATQDAWRALPAADQARLAPDRLILPHPRLQDRAFVLVPLADVAPDWRHPRLGLTIRQMRDALPPAALDEVVPL